MNNLRVLLVLFSFSMLVSCTKEEADVTSTTSGWKVTLFTEDGTNKTNSFEGFIFDFQSGSIVTATKGSEVVNGVWKEVDDSGSKKFVMEFALKSGAFDAISEDWLIRSKNESSIKLIRTKNLATVVNNDVLEFTR